MVAVVDAAVAAAVGTLVALLKVDVHGPARSLLSVVRAVSEWGNLAACAAVAVAVAAVVRSWFTSGKEIPLAGSGRMGSLGSHLALAVKAAAPAPESARTCVLLLSSSSSSESSEELSTFITRVPGRGFVWGGDRDRGSGGWVCEVP